MLSAVQMTLTQYLIFQRPFEDAAARSLSHDLLFSPAVIMSKDNASDTGVSCRQLVLTEPHRPWGCIVHCPMLACNEEDPNMMKIHAKKEKGSKAGTSYTVDCQGCGMRAPKFKQPNNVTVYRNDVMSMAFPPPDPDPAPLWRPKGPNQWDIVDSPNSGPYSPPRKAKKRWADSGAGLK